MMGLPGLLALGLISAPAPAADGRLQAVLDKAGAYCVRLNKSALDFTCTEEVREIQHAGRILSQEERAFAMRRGWVEEWDDLLSRKENTWVYDYQLIRRGDIFEERRTQLLENGRAKRVDDARLGSHRIKYRKLILCPVSFLDAEARKTHTYRLDGEDTVFERPAVVVEARPLPDHPEARAGIPRVGKEGTIESGEEGTRTPTSV